jgi:putative PIN family toxin of toxin-antitoxin system
MQLRTVFDTNIYVAAALRPGQHADRWLDIASLPASGLQLFVSAEILDELYQKLTEKFGFDRIEVRRFIKRIEIIARVVKPTMRLDVVPNDQDDNIIVECAVAARAHLIVSADADLLKLGQYKGIGIAHPRELKHIFATDFEGNK